MDLDYIPGFIIEINILRWAQYLILFGKFVNAKNQETI